MAETSNLTLNALLNVAYGTFTRGQEFQKAIAQFMRKGASEGAQKGAKEASKTAAASWAKVHGAMIEGGLKKQATAFKEESESRNRNLKQLAIKSKALTREIEDTEDEALKARLETQRDELKIRIGMERKAQANSESVAGRMAQERLKLIESYEEKLDKTRSESMAEAGENVQNIIKTAFSADGLDLEAISETLTKGLSGGLEGLAGAVGSEGGALTGTFSALAEAATVIGAAVGPIAALASVMAMAYNQTKDMNKELLSTASSFDLIGSGAEKVNVAGIEVSALTVRLSAMRKEVQDVAYDLRLSGAEVMTATTALAEAGITFKEFTDIARGAGGQFASFDDVLRSSLSAAYGLGLEVSEVAEYYGKMTADLGYNLGQIEGSFGLISEQAQLAGMRTKDFFAAVNESATGMALYNFRIGDTATLLTDLVKILGEDLGKEKMKLDGTFKGMGMQEKYKQTILGGSRYAGAVRADMRNQAGEFSKNLAGTAGEAGLRKNGLLGDNGQINTKQLASLSGKAFRDALETSDLSKTQKRQLQTLRGISQAEKGGMGVAEASGHMTRRGELAAQMAQGSAMFGGKLLSELHGVERMMAEEVTGRSGEDYDTLSRIQEQSMAQYEQMKKANDPKVMGKTFEDAFSQGLLSSGDKDVDSLANKKHFTEVEQAAREQLKETRSISQTVTNVIQQLLGRIALGIEVLSSFFADDETEKNIAKQTSESIARQEELSKVIEALSTTISDKKYTLQETADPEARAKLQAEIDAATKERDSKTKAMQEESDIQRGVSRGKTADQVRADIMKEQYGSQMSNISPEKLKEIGLGRFVQTYADADLADSMGGRRGASGSGTVSQISGELTDLTEEEKKRLEQMFEQDKQSALDAQIRGDEDTKLTKDNQKELVTTLQKMNTMEAIQQLGSYLSLTENQIKLALKGDAGTLAEIEKALDVGGRTEAEALLIARTGWGIKTDQEKLSGATPGEGLKDFIYRGDGTRGIINPIDKEDHFFGAKPGGAIDKALASKGGKTVVVNINGGDDARVYNVLKRVLTETGYPGMKSY